MRARPAVLGPNRRGKSRQRCHKSTFNKLLPEFSDRGAERGLEDKQSIKVFTAILDIKSDDSLNSSEFKAYDVRNGKA